MSGKTPRDSNTEMISWLLQNVEDDHGGKLSINEILTKVNGIGLNISSVALGILVLKVFPQVRAKQERCKNDWSKREKVYHGITWRHGTCQKDPVTENSSFFDIMEYISLEKTFLIEKSETDIKLGMFTGHLVNGNRLLAEINFKSNLSWSVMVCGKIVDLKGIGLSNAFILSKQSIDVILSTVKKMKFCKGLSSSDNMLVYNAHLKEVWSKPGDENSCISIMRSQNCSVVMPLTSKKTTCCNCFQLQIPRNLIQQNSNNLSAAAGTVTTGIDPNNPPFINLPASHEITGLNPTAPLTTPSPEVTGDEEHDITLSDADHQDFSTILDQVIPNCPTRLKTFLMSQKVAIERHPKGRRWDKEILRLCLTLWCRSPRGYDDVRSSGFVVLPSSRILQYYNNSVNQVSGFNKDMFHWMLNEAKNRNLPPEGYEGGLLLDEMSLQQDIQISKKGGDIKLIGFKDVTEESAYIDKLLSHKKEISLASHALQFMFLGLTGFRFPFTYFATTGASASELYLVFWKAINYLSMFNFKVIFVSMDGAQTNRDFMNILLGHMQGTGSFTLENVFNPSSPKISIIMDFSHAMKKIRNNIYKSGTNSYDKRHLCCNGKFIYWEHWRKAYLWDISSNPFPIHQKLNHDHFFLTSESKMRNHLAENVLDKEMLHLMKSYKVSLSTEEGEKLVSSIELLEQTSILIKNFRDSRPITNTADIRLAENDRALQWFLAWEKDIIEDQTKRKKEKFLISHQTRQDISSLVTGFKELCFNKLSRSSSSIIPCRVNSDVIENLFCQERALHNGANTNPTFLGYAKTVNTIVLGQSTVSKNSNAGKSGAEPYNFSKPKANKKRKC